MYDTEVRKATAEDRPWMDAYVRDRWHGDIMVAKGKVFRPAEHSGLIALRYEEPVGLLTYRIEGDDCEITLIDAVEQGSGVGTALIDAVAHHARKAACRRLWLVTTNDNLRALRFYQRRGFVLSALRPNALEESRKLKPEISMVGQHGIPLRDEIELERML